MSQIFVWIIFAISLLILVTFIVLYFRGVFRSRTFYKIKNLPPPATANFPVTIASLSDSFITHGKVTGFCREAADIFAARLEVINSACKSIQFETYIITPGKRADDFAQALIKKAQAGVIVQVIADTYGAKTIPKEYWNKLKAAGVEMLLFNPFTWRDPAANLRRNHRKLLIVDGEIVLIGGAGVSDLWDGKDETENNQPWLDYEVCFQGSLVARFQGIFLQHWLDTGGSLDWNSASSSQPHEQEETLLITKGEDPTQQDSGIRALFETILQAARKRIWIASPYFLPNPNSCKILQQAKARGIDVKILTMGVDNDKPPVRYASRRLYPKLLKAGIEIYEYQPSMMHAKCLLIDDDWVSLGSANLDSRSLFHNDELNISTSDRYLFPQIEKFFLDAFVNSRLVSKRDLRHRSLQEHLIGSLTLLFRWYL